MRWNRGLWYQQASKNISVVGKGVRTHFLSLESVSSRGPYSFIHSFNKHSLNTYCVPDAVLGTRDTAVNKVGESPCLGEERQATHRQIHTRAASGEKSNEENKSGLRGQAVSSVLSHQISSATQEIGTLLAPLAQIRKYIQRGEVTCPRSHSCEGTEPEFEWVPQSWEQTEGYNPRLNEWRLPLQGLEWGQSGKE